MAVCVCVCVCAWLTGLVSDAGASPGICLFVRLTAVQSLLGSVSVCLLLWHPGGAFKP